MSGCTGWYNVNYGDQIMLYNVATGKWVGTGGNSAPFANSKDSCDWDVHYGAGQWQMGISSELSNAEAFMVMSANGTVPTGATGASGISFSTPIMLLDQSRMTGTVNSMFTFPQPTNLFD